MHSSAIPLIIIPQVVTEIEGNIGGGAQRRIIVQAVDAAAAAGVVDALPPLTVAVSALNSHEHLRPPLAADTIVVATADGRPNGAPLLGGQQQHPHAACPYRRRCTSLATLTNNSTP